MNIHFDWLAPVYDRLIGDHGTVRLAELLALPADGILLDAGGGTGRVSARFKNDISRIILCDWSKPMLKEAKLKGGLMPVNGKIECLPLAAESVDRILVVDALHHFPNQSLAVAMMAQALKPGGRLVIEEPDIGRFVTKMIAWAEKLTLMGSHFHSPPEIAAMMEACGLKASVETNERISAWIVGEKPLSETHHM